MKKRVALHNLGCKVNAYEMENMAEALIAEGFTIVPFASSKRKCGHRTPPRAPFINAKQHEVLLIGLS